MPCPYFIPRERFEDGAFPHPARLPLGAAFRGLCGAPGCGDAIPTDEELKQICNLGYARNCSRLPENRTSDAVRFSVLRDRDGLVSLCYVAELNYLPVEQSNLHYDLQKKTWSRTHSDVKVQSLADCFLQSYLVRR